jgi:hypothetical protein
MTKFAGTAVGALVLAAVTVVLLLLVRANGPGHFTTGLRYEGGPNPSALANVWEPGVIRVYRSDGSFVTSRHLAANETFSMDLSPATYRVLGHSGDADCVPQTFTVTSAGTTLVPVKCGVK